jgi:hypothetical protein
LSAECPPNLFKEFEAGCGSFVKPDKDGLSYIYEVLFSHFEHAEAIEFTYPRLPEATFADWKEFEFWCDEIKPEFINHISPYDENDSEFFTEFPTPKAYFRTKKNLKSIIINTLHDENEGVVYVEIICGNKKLFLIYLDSDAWVLGHASSVLVLRSLEELIPKNGFYSFKK